MDYEMVLAWVIVSIVVLLVFVPALGYPFVSYGGKVKYVDALLFGCFLIISFTVALFVLFVVLWAFFKVMIG